MPKKALLLFFVCGMNEAAELNIASIDWCPQLCVGSKAAGYITDTVMMAFLDSEYTLDIQTYPWSRSIKMVEVGKKHALLSPAKKEAPNLIYPRNEVGIQRMCFFTTKSSKWSFDGLGSLKGLSIGIASNTSVEELTSYVTANDQQFQYMPYNESYIEKSLKKLKAKRIDSFLFTYNSTQYKMMQMGVAKDYRVAGCISQAKVYLAFSPTNSLNTKKMIEYFDLKMDQLKASGAIKKIMESYGLENWQQFSTSH